MTIRLLLASLLLLGTIAIVRAAPHAAGVCYATDGTSVETTYINGGGAFYPHPSQAVIEPFDNGFTVTHRTVFERLGARMYLPVVSR